MVTHLEVGRYRERGWGECSPAQFSRSVLRLSANTWWRASWNAGGERRCQMAKRTSDSLHSIVNVWHGVWQLACLESPPWRNNVFSPSDKISRLYLSRQWDTPSTQAPPKWWPSSGLVLGNQREPFSWKLHFLCSRWLTMPALQTCATAFQQKPRKRRYESNTSRSSPELYQSLPFCSMDKCNKKNTLTMAVKTYFS